METFTSGDGTTIGCRRTGTGDPLLLVHGTAADHRRWDGVAPAFESHYTVYAMDRRGRGASTDSYLYDVAREAGDIAAVVDDVGGSVNVVAHSYGAVCALEATRLTTGIGRLVLYEPPIPTGLPMYPPDIPGRMQNLTDAGAKETALEVFLREVIGVSAEGLDTYRSLPTWEQRVDLVPTIQRELVIDRFYTFDPAKFQHMTVPTLLLVGSESPPIFQRAIEAVDDALPDSTVVTLEGQEHAAMDTAPDMFIVEVRNFLGEQRNPGL